MKLDESGGVLQMELKAAGKMARSVRNLRLREDKAKYLYNLDVDRSGLK